MLIRHRPIITWLLSDVKKIPDGIFLGSTSNPLSTYMLNEDFQKLEDVRKEMPKWGLPELLMPSFAEKMKECASAFEERMPEFVAEFSLQGECGILLYKDMTLVYSFGNDTLDIWFFEEQDGHSVFKFFSCTNFAGDGMWCIGINRVIINDDKLFSVPLDQRENFVGFVLHFVALFVAVKRKVEIETVIVPPGKFTDVEGTPLANVDKKKVLNQTGQRVVVMDSRWFREIVNEKLIKVKGFWRRQNKKDSNGQWYRERIYVDSFMRGGYHRKAKVKEVKA